MNVIKYISIDRPIVLFVITLSMISLELPMQINAQEQQLTGHVSVFERYSLPNFNGCHAIVNIDMQPNPIIALSSNDGICNTLTSALFSGYKISFFGELNSNPPIIRPGSGPFLYSVYNVDIVILYNAK